MHCSLLCGRLSTQFAAVMSSEDLTKNCITDVRLNTGTTNLDKGFIEYISSCKTNWIMKKMIMKKYISRLLLQKKSSLKSSFPFSTTSSSSSSSSSTTTTATTTTTTVSSKDIFDRELKKRQRDLAFHKVGSDYYDYLKMECADRLVDRLEDITRSFPYALELGCHRGHVVDIIDSKVGLNGKGGVGGIEELVMTDMNKNIIDYCNEKYNNNEKNVKTYKLVVDDEDDLPFDDHTFDLILTSLNMHWINDFPKNLKEMRRVLKPDGAVVGSLLGGNTLMELRHCFYLAEMERKGGLSPHASPLAKASDIAGLMQGAGFNLPTIDVDTITIGYPDFFSLMEHIKNMGENTAAFNRQLNVGKDTFLAAASIYERLYAMEDGTIPATFQVIYFIGWTPHDSQPKACKRGSGTAKIGKLAQ